MAVLALAPPHLHVIMMRYHCWHPLCSLGFVQHLQETLLASEALMLTLKLI